MYIYIDTCICRDMLHIHTPFLFLSLSLSLSLSPSTHTHTHVRPLLAVMISGQEFSGATLSFCGLVTDANHRKLQYTYAHEKAGCSWSSESRCGRSQKNLTPTPKDHMHLTEWCPGTTPFISALLSRSSAPARVAQSSTSGDKDTVPWLLWCAEQRPVCLQFLLMMLARECAHQLLLPWTLAVLSVLQGSL